MIVMKNIQPCMDAHNYLQFYIALNQFRVHFFLSNNLFPIPLNLSVMALQFSTWT